MDVETEIWDLTMFIDTFLQKNGRIRLKAPQSFTFVPLLSNSLSHNELAHSDFHFSS